MEIAKESVPIVILCGGEGTRFREETQYRPKPLVDIGNMPVLWHVMNIYAFYGFTNFILCLGYKGEMIKDYFLNLETRSRDFVLDLNNGEYQFIDKYDRPETKWRVSFVETGAATMTGARVKKIEHLVKGEHFMVTYADGVADIDINALFDQHIKNGTIGTVTGVHATSQFGELRVEDDRVIGFSEKPMVKSIINGGFFVFNKKFFDYLTSNEECILEEQPMRNLTRDGELGIYRHEGFWQCLDTYKDHRFLNEVWKAGNAPWTLLGDK